MGIYLNPRDIDFQRALNSGICVDKSELIKYTNSEKSALDIADNAIFSPAKRS